MEKLNETSQIRISEIIKYAENHSNIRLKIADIEGLDINYSLATKMFSKTEKTVALRSLESCKNLVQDFFEEEKSQEHKAALTLVKRWISITKMFIEIANDEKTKFILI